MGLKILKKKKKAQGTFFFCQPSAFSFCSRGMAVHSYRFFTALLHYGFFPPPRHSIIMHFILRLFFITCRAKGVCVCVCVCMSPCIAVLNV